MRAVVDHRCGTVHPGMAELVETLSEASRGSDTQSSGAKGHGHNLMWT
jgi:hypothetical protein